MNWHVLAARAADDKLASNTIVLDVGDVVGITDHFIITSGSSRRQVRAIAEGIEADLKLVGGPSPKRIEGLREAEWILLDFGIFVVHVFGEEARRYFDLERLWQDCNRVEWLETN